jgi:hypothetical protein
VSVQIHLWPGPDEAPPELDRGRHLLVACPAARTASIPAGVLLDDWLDFPARVEIEDRARAATRAWVSDRRAALTVEGADLGWIWEVELYRDAFLPVERLLASVTAAVRGLGAERLEPHGLDPRTVAALVEALAPLGCEVASAGAAELTVPDPLSSLSPLQRALIASGAGAPQRVRGNVLMVNAPTSLPVARALERPVLDPASLPALGRSGLARALWRGGWVGVPGRVRRRRSAKKVSAALRGATEVTPAEEPAAQLAHERAVELLQRRAPGTLALVDRYARALGAGRIEVVVVPFDSLSSVRVLLSASRAAGVPSLLIQHGYAPEPNDPDKGETDHTAAWAERDAREVRERHGRAATVTGNPAAPPAVTPPKLSGGGPTLALVQSPTVFSARWDARVSERFVRRAAEQAPPGGELVLRPHPLEPSPEAFLRLVPEEVEARVDVATPLAELLAECDQCVGGVSTATLQAGVAGLPTTFLDVTGGELPEPFERAGELAQEPLAEALGVTGDATQRVIDLIDQLAAASA